MDGSRRAIQPATFNLTTNYRSHGTYAVSPSSRGTSANELTFLSLASLACVRRDLRCGGRADWHHQEPVPQLDRQPRAREGSRARPSPKLSHRQARDPRPGQSYTLAHASCCRPSYPIEPAHHALPLHLTRSSSRAPRATPRSSLVLNNACSSGPKPPRLPSRSSLETEPV